MKLGAGGTVAFSLYLLALVFLPTRVSGTQLELLTDRTPADVSYLAMRAIPQLVYHDQPDSLLAWLEAWEKASGPLEPIQRVRILGAIWDDQFSESLYDGRIIAQLLSLDAPEALPKPADDLLADGPSAAAVGRDFEDFCRTFADQLLPHVSPNSPAEFFCLMYSGRQTQAWTLLASDALKETDLREYRDRTLKQAEYEFPAYLVVSGGYWSPFGKYSFAGNHPLAGLEYGVRSGSWYLQVTGEIRLGRANRPYLAREKDTAGISDRFSATLLGLELGRNLITRGPWQVGIGGGIGLDSVKPLKDEDFHLDALHLAGGGYLSLDLDRHRHKYLILTLRREWTRPRNREGSALWGDAWSARLGVGMNLSYQATETRRLLQP